jgi:hypothetical protein
MWRERKKKGEREKHMNRFKRESGMRVNDLERKKKMRERH